MKKIAWFSLVCLLFIGSAGCVVAHPTTAPPPAKKEIRPAKPGPMYVWISGHWKWKGSQYVWVSGRWVRAPRGKVWVRGHWVKRRGHWVWIAGHWRRR
ncbi:MAG: YXWGXW repeat-containing protein [Candidatus Aminicenantes bacterium]|jgi:hypothetical protein